MDEKMERETGGHKETKTTSKTDGRKEGRSKRHYKQTVGRSD